MCFHLMYILSKGRLKGRGKSCNLLVVADSRNPYSAVWVPEYLDWGILQRLQMHEYQESACRSTSLIVTMVSITTIIVSIIIVMTVIVYIIVIMTTF